jgi:hypothetical protein
MEQVPPFTTALRTVCTYSCTGLVHWLRGARYFEMVLHAAASQRLANMDAHSTFRRYQRSARVPAFRMA